MRTGLPASRIWVGFLLLLGACSRPATGPRGPLDSAPISADEVRPHVEALAGDPWEGRGAGYAGEDRAVSYIARQFERIGLRPAGDPAPSGRTFVQRFRFHPRGPEIPGQTLVSHNVLGFLEGDDENLRQEIVVLGAHHDGQGRSGQADADRFPAEDGSTGDEIWNSADDNASSVAALLEVARSLVRNKGPHHRSILFVTFGAEEHALNGSVYYAAQPAFPLSQHVAMVNLEKLGRVPEQELAAAATGTCACWEEVLAAANRETGWKVASAIREVVPDTDHYPFAATGIPAIVLGTIHEQDTHRPTDSTEKIEFTRLAARATYVRSLTRELVNRRQTPRFSGVAPTDLGLIPVVASEAELRDLGLPPGSGALKVSALIPGLPAEMAGLVPGDLIVALQGTPLKRDPRKEAVQEAANRRPGGLTISLVRAGLKRELTLKCDLAARAMGTPGRT